MFFKIIRIIRVLQKTFAPAHHNPSKCTTSRSRDWRNTYDLGKLESLNNFKVTESFSFAEKTIDSVRGENTKH